MSSSFMNEYSNRRSLRIKENNEQISTVFVNKLFNLIKVLNNYKNCDEKLSCLTSMYQLILENMNILAFSLRWINFFIQMLMKKTHVDENLNSDDKKEKKTLIVYKNFYKVYYVFQKKVFDILFEKRNNKYKEKQDCSICMEVINKKDLVITNCNHYFHQKCLVECFSVNKCPNCRNCLYFTK